VQRLEILRLDSRSRDETDAQLFDLRLGEQMESLADGVAVGVA
jgi:hypothetical protein